MIDEQLISFVIKYGALSQIQQSGIDTADFIDEYCSIWKYLMRMKRDHDTIPSVEVLLARFPDFSYTEVLKRDLPLMVHQIKERTKVRNTLTALNEAASDIDLDNIDDVIQKLQSSLNSIAFTGQGKAHLVDLFSEAVSKEIQGELMDLRSGKKMGIPTGLTTFDQVAGGMRPQQMMVIIGRSGIGKSWIDLLAVANAVMNGYKFILYPLEMSLFETATRLYTIFTQAMWGADKVLKNYDLNTGAVNMRKVVRFMNALQDKFEGQLLVADVGSLADPYTVERIEAEVDIHKPDGFWVDYITLLKPPSGAGDDGWQGVRQLSSGIKNTAMRRNVVGGCSAQVNREAIKSQVFLPRLEHISFGDSIGQDADKVVSINRKGKYLYWSLVKNRGGAEIKMRKVLFDVDQGILREMPRQQDEQEDETPDANG